MRVCRLEEAGEPVLGVLTDNQRVHPLSALAEHVGLPVPAAHSVLDLLPGGQFADFLPACRERTLDDGDALIGRPLDAVRLLVPVPAPQKLILLAGNYAKHVAEQGGHAEEREQTVPYLFMKPLTTLTHPGDPIRIPDHSPDQIDWEVELGVIIGRTCRDVPAESALEYVAGYSVINDISDRKYQPNPGRVPRPKDSFFDWQHGKWHDTFCPMGPCVLPADRCADPQQLRLTLRVNDRLEQDGSTAQMIFPVADVIAFVSRLVTLLPGDIISTGTPDGVGKAKGRFLQRGDQVQAAIDGIGVLSNPVA